MYPNGFAVENAYNNDGSLQQVTRVDNSELIWEAGTITSKGEWLDYSLGNNLLNVTKTYDTEYFLSSIQTERTASGSLIQNYSYDFDPYTGNLMQRIDHLPWISASLTEDFDYDEMNRLKKWQINNSGWKNITYDDDYANGRILSKEETGNYNHGNRPNAVNQLTNYPTGNPLEYQDITYNLIDKTEQIIQGDWILSFTYGPGKNRRKVEYEFDDNVLYNKYYTDGYEETGTRSVCYIPGGDGLAAIYFDDGNGNEDIYYILKDHLGSIRMIIDNNGEVATWHGQKQEFSYDAWGRRRDPLSGEYITSYLNCMIDRGFTGHEHLDEFNLINMNGRIYDPLLGMFLSPDNYVHPGSSIGYNRYSYCLNNPLVYTDPDGENPILAVLAIGMILKTGGEGMKLYGEMKDNSMYMNMGSILSSIGNIVTGFSGLGPIAQPILSGMLKGGDYYMNGGNFSEGFWDGAKWGLISSAAQGLLSDLPNSRIMAHHPDLRVKVLTPIANFLNENQELIEKGYNGLVQFASFNPQMLDAANGGGGLFQPVDLSGDDHFNQLLRAYSYAYHYTKGTLPAEEQSRWNNGLKMTDLVNFESLKSAGLKPDYWGRYNYWTSMGETVMYVSISPEKIMPIGELSTEGAKKISLKTIKYKGYESKPVSYIKYSGRYNPRRSRHLRLIYSRIWSIGL